MTASSSRLRALRGRSFNDVDPRLLGAVALVAVTALAAFAFAIGSLGLFEETYRMSGVFPESGGLRSGDAVRLAGVDVGSVTAVRPDFEQGHVVVTWEVDEGVHVGHEATAEISLSTLLGGRYLRLDGPVEAPFMADLDADDRRIPLERTRVPIGVQDALGQLSETFDAVDVEQVDLLLDNLAAVAGDSAEDFEPLLRDVSTLSSLLNQRRDQIDSLLDETTQLTSALAAKDEALLALIDQAGALLDEVAARRDQVAALLGDGAAVAQQLDTLVRTNRESLDALLADLDVTLDTVRGRLPELNQTLAFLAPSLTGLRNTTVNGPWVDTVVVGVGLVQLADLLETAAAP